MSTPRTFIPSPHCKATQDALITGGKCHIADDCPGCADEGYVVRIVTL
jgi:hypothetical protein